MEFTTEQQSKDYFKKVLTKKGFTDINEPEDQFCYYDLQANKDNKVYRFELKRRRMNSTKHNDGIMEAHKYRKFYQEKDQYDYAFLVSMFYDKIGISDIKHPVETIARFASKTTDFDNNQVVEKQMIRYNLHKLIEYDDEI